MSRDNPLWGAPRIHGERLQLGIDIGETSLRQGRSRNAPPTAKLVAGSSAHHDCAKEQDFSSPFHRLAATGFLYLAATGIKPWGAGL
jgi:hypothetical protein